MRPHPVDSGYVGELFPVSETASIYLQSMEDILHIVGQGPMQLCLEDLEYWNGVNRKWQEEIMRKRVLT